MEVVFKVKGMHCQKCVDKIEKFVGEIDGVSFVGVDLKNQKVQILCKDSIKTEVLKEAIFDSGFEVEE